MGGVVSTVKILLAFCWSLNSSLTPLVKRIHSDPGRPSANPTKSFWLSRPHPHVAAHQSPSLPTEVDVVIIGSGITGTAVAKTLLLLQQLDDGTPSLRVAMLDARDACSGATGRNGGHIKESAYLEYAGLKKKYGKAVAMEVVRFRLAHLDALVAVAEAEGADVVRESRIRRCDTADVCFEESVWEGSKRKLEVFLEDFEDQRGLWVVHEAEEARKVRFLGGSFFLLSGFVFYVFFSGALPSGYCFLEYLWSISGVSLWSITLEYHSLGSCPPEHCFLGIYFLEMKPAS